MYVRKVFNNITPLNASEQPMGPAVFVRAIPGWSWLGWSEAIVWIPLLVCLLFSTLPFHGWVGPLIPLAYLAIPCKNVLLQPDLPHAVPSS